jgi:hypothetical protein
VTFLFYFLSYLPAGQAVRAVGGAFAAVSGEVARNPFYRQVAGLDDPLGNLRRMVIMAGAIGGLVLLGIAADVVARRYGPRVQASVAVACGSLAFCVLVIRAKILPWLELPRALPLTTAAILIVLLILLGRSSVSVESRGTLFPALLATTFSLALLVKSTLYLHVYHYGFYLALPSTVALVVCCLEGIPRLLERRGGGRVFRGLAVGVAAAGMILHVNLSQRIYGAKTYPVGRGGDRIVTYAEAYDDSGPIVAAALEWIERNTSPGESLVGLPEGIMLNYLARRPTRTPCMNFMMTEMIQFGEHELLTSLRADPPDYVAIVHKDTSEFGVRFFGQDARYGQAIMTWLESRYRTVARFGAEPLQDRRFGIRILKRIEGPEAAP